MNNGFGIVNEDHDHLNRPRTEISRNMQKNKITKPTLICTSV